jgi:hypothetical protein
MGFDRQILGSRFGYLCPQFDPYKLNIKRMLSSNSCIYLENQGVFNQNTSPFPAAAAKVRTNYD